jgi:hypothetical protein
MNYWHEHQEKWSTVKAVWQGVPRMTQPRGTRNGMNLEMSLNPFRTPIRKQQQTPTQTRKPKETQHKNKNKIQRKLQNYNPKPKNQ